ncbi:MAG TPA: iron-containing alcohol dehydrogenase [Polyangiales bacterium]|nr:iron-containing alcohol dehydrogenase [Polyangiales bacterium]
MTTLPAFEFATATRIVFGAGKLSEVPALLAELGAQRVLFVTGRDPARSSALETTLRSSATGLLTLRVSGEPTVDWVRDSLVKVREVRSEAVVAFGGGSVIDAAKALAALAANGGDPLDYLEVIGRGQALAKPSLPLIAIPTTAGTGAEVTRNAVLGSTQERVKASLRSPLMLPRIALIDPDLLAGAPPEVLRSSGLDALSQLIEPFLSSRANPISDALAREGIARSARSLRRAVLGEADASAREDLAVASLFGGLCLANSGLGAVHGFAAPAGGMFQAPHGAVCAALLPHAMDVNLKALTSRDTSGRSVARFHELARLLSGDTAADGGEAVEWVATLCRELGVPGLSAYGMTANDIPALVAKAKVASSMRANPIALTDAELTEIAERSL